jgi:hypothetical protein
MMGLIKAAFDFMPSMGAVELSEARRQSFLGQPKHPLDALPPSQHACSQ